MCQRMRSALPVRSVVIRVERVARFRAGATLPASPMAWGVYGNMRDEDLKAMYRYLKGLPPQSNDPGPAHRPAD